MRKKGVKRNASPYVWMLKISGAQRANARPPAVRCNALPRKRKTPHPTLARPFTSLKIGKIRPISGNSDALL